MTAKRSASVTDVELTRVFTRLVCGIDGSPASIEAAWQASRIADPSSSTLLVTAIEYALDKLWDAPHGERLATATRLQREAVEALDRARRVLETHGPVEARSVEGSAGQVVLARVAADSGCLLGLGAPGYGRARETLARGVVTELLRQAPCSMLVARTPPDPERFPRLIVVGIDGSPQSAGAFAAAWALRERFDAELRPVVGLGGKGVDIEAVQRIVRGFEFKVDKRRPVQALASASGDADLVVVGSRGLHGARALGSVSEQVAHRARSSVLVVRGALA